MGKADVKSTKNTFKSLTKRQKLILAGVSAGLLSLVMIVIIACLWPKEEKRKQNISGEKEIGDSDNPSEAYRRNEPGVGKSLGAKTLVANYSPASDSQGKSEEPNESSETRTEKASKKTSDEAPKVTPDLIETKVLITPVKEIQKKQPTVSLKTCADYQSALSEALKKNNKKTDLETLYAKVQELCKGTFITQTLDEHVKQQFEARKAQIFASERPTNNDFSELMVLQSNLKKLDDTYVPVKTLEQEFCDHFGDRFTAPFGKVEADPEIVDGKDCALDAQKFFHAARTFSKNSHPAYDFEDLEKYVTAKVEELLTPLSADVMKYIQILRYLNPNSSYAFPDCNDLAAVQTKMTERRIAVFKSINLTNGLLSMKIIKILDNDQVEALIERSSDLIATTKLLEKLAAEINMPLLKLVKLARGMDDIAQAWMNSGFHIRKSTEFQTFANKQLTMADRSNLKEAMNLAFWYHKVLHVYLKTYGFSDDADKHQVEMDLVRFLNKAFKSTDEIVLHTVMDFASADTIESVPGFVTFFEDHKDLEDIFGQCFYNICKLPNKQAGIYRLIRAQLREINILKKVEGVNMDAPKDAKEWFNRVVSITSDKLEPVFNLARNTEEATSAKHDMLPDGDKRNNDVVDSIYRPVAVLTDMKEKYEAIRKQLDTHLQTFGVSDIRTALDKRESYKDSHPEFYQFLKANEKILEYNVLGFETDYAIQEVSKTIKQNKKLVEQSKLYENVSLIVSIFDEDPDNCVLQADGTISCQNKFMEDKLLELEQDATRNGHKLFVQFLSEARKLNTKDDVRNLAHTYLDAERADCDASIKQHHACFGSYLSGSFD